MPYPNPYAAGAQGLSNAMIQAMQLKMQLRQLDLAEARQAKQDAYYDALIKESSARTGQLFKAEAKPPKTDSIEVTDQRGNKYNVDRAQQPDGSFVETGRTLTEPVQNLPAESDLPTRIASGVAARLQEKYGFWKPFQGWGKQDFANEDIRTAWEEEVQEFSRTREGSQLTPDDWTRIRAEVLGQLERANEGTNKWFQQPFGGRGEYELPSEEGLLLPDDIHPIMSEFGISVPEGTPPEALVAVYADLARAREQDRASGGKYQQLPKEVEMAKEYLRSIGDRLARERGIMTDESLEAGERRYIETGKPSSGLLPVGPEKGYGQFRAEELYRRGWLAPARKVKTPNQKTDLFDVRKPVPLSSEEAEELRKLAEEDPEAARMFLPDRKPRYNRPTPIHGRQRLFEW